MAQSPKDDPRASLDRMRVDQAYERLNHLWALHGVATIGSIYQYPGPRANVMGLDDSEVDRVIRGIQTFFAWGENHDWIEEWTRAGDDYARRADAAMAAGHAVTAGETWRLASACYFFGWYIHNHFVPIPARDRAQTLCIEAYRKAAPHLLPPSERVEIPFRGRALPGYLRRPDGGRSVSRWPVVIVAGGANSTKEENHPLTAQFLQRGMATFAYDGPGQNEYVLNGGEPLRMSLFDESVTAVVSALAADNRVDPDRIAIFGRSGGGITVLHAAASEHRLKAVVAHPGTFSWGRRLRANMDVLTLPMELAHWLGATSLAEIPEVVARELTLEGVVERIRAPILLINGRHDPIFPYTEAEQIRERAKAPVDVVYFDLRAHGGPPSLSWPLAADWLADHLGAPGPDGR
jgi:dipeptidyl aminopeptidase/acylaminoacyl peptidase